MANTKEAINDSSINSTDDWERKVIGLQKKFENFEKEASGMNNRIQILSDENKVLRSELKQVKENRVRLVEGEENTVKVHFATTYEDFQDDEEISAEENSAAKNNATKLCTFRSTSIHHSFAKKDKCQRRTF